MGNCKNPCNWICENRFCGIACIAILFLLGAGSIIQIFFVSDAIEEAFYDAVTETVVMTADAQRLGTEEYRNWISNNNSDAPVQLFEFWVYNVTNPFEVVKGDYPIFDLLGPFVFRRYEEKRSPIEENVTDDEPIFYEEEDESIVEYDYNYHFEFDKNQSNDTISLDDMIWAVSGAMQGLFLTINTPGLGELIPDCVNEAIGEWPGEAVFYHTSIYDLAYGIEDQWILSLDDACEGNGIWDFVRPNTLFSLIADGRHGVIQHTGKANLTNLGELIQYRNWTTPRVNSYKMQQGDLWTLTEETVEGARETRNFPPKNWINKDRELTIWSVEKFRKTKYLFDRDVVYKGVDLMRFRISDDELKACQYEYNETDGSIIGESANCKYWQNWEDGIWNLTNLRGSPSIISKGRFLDAPYFINTTNIAFGIPLPNYEDDDQYFDVDPRAGIVFRNFHNYQINFLFGPADRDFPTNFTNFTIFDRLLPMAYIRVEALATNDQMDFYKSTLNAIDIINGFSLYGGPAFAVICFGLMFFILCKMKRKGIGFTDNDSEYGRLIEDNGDNIAMATNENGGGITPQKQNTYGTATNVRV